MDNHIMLKLMNFFGIGRRCNGVSLESKWCCWSNRRGHFCRCADRPRIIKPELRK